MGVAMKRARWFLASGGRPLYAFGSSPSRSPPDPDRLRLFLADSRMNGTVPDWDAATAATANAAQLEFNFA